MTAQEKYIYIYINSMILSRCYYKSSNFLKVFSYLLDLFFGKIDKKALSYITHPRIFLLNYQHPLSKKNAFQNKQQFNLESKIIKLSIHKRIKVLSYNPIIATALFPLKIIFNFSLQLNVSLQFNYHIILKKAQ